MAVWMMARARAFTVGPRRTALIASSVSSFQPTTTLSPVAARTGWGRPTVATRPTIRMSTKPMTVVSLRICRRPSAARPARSRRRRWASRRGSGTLAGARTGNARAGRVRPAVQPPRHYGPVRRPARPGPDRWRAVTHSPASGGKSPTQARTGTAAAALKAAEVRGQIMAESVLLSADGRSAPASRDARRAPFGFGLDRRQGGRDRLLPAPRNQLTPALSRSHRSAPISPFVGKPRAGATGLHGKHERPHDVRDRPADQSEVDPLGPGEPDQSPPSGRPRPCRFAQRPSTRSCRPARPGPSGGRAVRAARKPAREGAATTGMGRA